MITPQNPQPAPNVVFCPAINLSTTVANGRAVIKTVQLLFQGAAVDGAGAWKVFGEAKSCQPFSFSFDAENNLVGLPADLRPATNAIAAAYQALETALDQINQIRKLV